MGPAARGRIKSVTRNHLDLQNPSPFNGWLVPEWFAGETRATPTPTPTTAPGFAKAPASAQVTNGRAWLLTGFGCQRGRASPSLLLGRHLRHANGMGTGEATGGREGGLATCRPRPPTNKPNHRLARQPGTRRRACVTQLDGPESH